MAGPAGEVFEAGCARATLVRLHRHLHVCGSYPCGLSMAVNQHGDTRPLACAAAIGIEMQILTGVRCGPAKGLARRVMSLLGGF